MSLFKKVIFVMSVIIVSFVLVYVGLRLVGKYAFTPSVVNIEQLSKSKMGLINQAFDYEFDKAFSEIQHISYGGAREKSLFVKLMLPKEKFDIEIFLTSTQSVKTSSDRCDLSISFLPWWNISKQNIVYIFTVDNQSGNYILFMESPKRLGKEFWLKLKE
jgi:hypothetical protein